MYILAISLSNPLRSYYNSNAGELLFTIPREKVNDLSPQENILPEHFWTSESDGVCYCSKCYITVTFFSPHLTVGRKIDYM